MTMSMVSSLKGNRADPPRPEWPGMPVRDHAEERIYEAAGDPADMFSFDQRIVAHRWLERMHQYNWERGNRPKYNFKLIFLIGKKGQGKSLSACYHASQLYAAGLPVFHNGAFLFGNELYLLELFLLLDRGPRGGAFWFDEIHTINQTSRELSTAQTTQVESMASLRKRDYWGAIGTSIPGLVGRRLRGEVDEIWMPNRLEVRHRGAGESDIHADGVMDVASAYMWDRPSRKDNPRSGVPPYDNRDNFQYVVKKMVESPWRDNSVFGLFNPELLEKRKPNGQPRPNPYFTQKMNPSWLRLSMMLLDSFLPVKLGVGVQAAQMTDEVKRQLGMEDDTNVISDLQVGQAIFDAFLDDVLDTTGHATPTDILVATDLGEKVTYQRMGKLCKSVWKVKYGSGRKGIDLADLYRYVSTNSAINPHAEDIL